MPCLSIKHTYLFQAAQILPLDRLAFTFEHYTSDVAVFFNLKYCFNASHISFLLLYGFH